MSDEHIAEYDACPWCPPACKSCVGDRDCECYTHQDWPEMSAALPAIRHAAYAGDSTRSPEADVRTLLAEIDRLREAIGSANSICSRRCFPSVIPSAKSDVSDPDPDAPTEQPPRSPR